MAGLILKLKPHEEIIVNGVVIENGDRQTKLRIRSDNAHVLRLREAIRPEDATTPFAQAYYAAQLAVCGDLDFNDATAIVSLALQRAGEDADAQNATDQDQLEQRRAAVSAAAAALQAGKFYRVMKALAGQIRNGSAVEKSGAPDIEAA